LTLTGSLGGGGARWRRRVSLAAGGSVTLGSFGGVTCCGRISPVSLLPGNCVTRLSGLLVMLGAQADSAEDGKGKRASYARPKCPDQEQEGHFPGHVSSIKVEGFLATILTCHKVTTNHSSTLSASPLHVKTTFPDSGTLLPSLPNSIDRNFLSLSTTPFK
jgi:hypothetical protein